ncbi:MAG TPA: serine/threonine-protein kinase [Hyalangium sp.]|nr:serine/threonine-protein kinase [Hyalangium sp.]
MAATSSQIFGKYVLLSKLAAGGMAITYRARMTGAAGVTKPCVIKQILPHFADDQDFVQMFVSEAKVAAQLTHGNIAQVFDFGEVDGQYFLALEFVHGQPLSKVLRRAAKMGMGFFPIPLALHIISKMCDGLDYAHRHVGENGEPMGLVHRDVSPDNVLISYEGEVKVIDFGIAKATSVVEKKTSPGVVKGKYPYFSPEQAKGRQDLDARTDVYAAGVVLYEALCGKRPFEGEFVAVLPRILAGDFVPPSQVNPAVSPQLEDILYRALALRREDRFQTAKELSEALVEMLYQENPRFTPSLLSQFVAHLFAEELTAEGRRVDLPPSFADHLSTWQNPGPTTPSGRNRLPSSGGGRVSSSGNRASGAVRTSSQRVSSSGGSKPPSNGGSRPSSGGGGRVSTSGVRRVPTAGGPRRTQASGTNSGIRRTTSERPALPDAPPRYLPDETSAEALPSLAMPLDVPLDDSTAPSPPAKAPQRTEVSVAATSVASARHGDPVAAVRALKVKEEKERAERTQRLVRNISLSIFAVVVVLVLFAVLRPTPEEQAAPTTKIWVISVPEGASMNLNGRELLYKTPMEVPGFIVNEANTLVLTLPGYRAWTKRFTPDGRTDPPLRAELERAEETPPPVVTPKPATLGDGGVEGTTSMGDEQELDYFEETYPTRLMVLRTAYNAFPISEYEPATIELNPAAVYSVYTEGSASYAQGGAGTNALAYLLEGDLSADESFGVLTGSPRVIKGARKMHVFAIDETPLSDNKGIVRVQFSESKWKPPRYLTFDAQKNALWLKREHQLWLHGLNPKADYLFTVRDDFAELNKGGKGRIRRALCVERGASPTARPTYRILETGKRYQLDGLESLRCTFPDTRLTDNEGAIEIDLVDVTKMSRKEREEYIRNTRFDR